jgi:lauroyl/myristoyl acyltransferase
MSIAATRETPHVPPHAPEVGWPRKILGPFYVTGIFWFRIHQLGVRLIPSWLVGSFVLSFTALFSVVLRNARAAVASNLEAVLGPCGWWARQARIFRTLLSFAWCLTERYERLSTDRKFLIGAEGLDHWRELNASGEGFILVTAHIGAWEVGSMLPAFQEERQVHVVREAETDPKAQKFFSELIRSRAGGLYTTHFADSPQLGVDLLDALRRGEIVALQGDRPRNGGRTAEISLFGRPFPVPVGPLALARAAGVPILPVFVFREGRLRYRCSLRPPIRVGTTGTRQAVMEEAQQRFAAELEWAISHRPHQWFCFRKLWERT